MTDLRTTIRQGVESTGERIQLEVYGYAEREDDRYLFTALAGVSVVLLGVSVRTALRGEPIGAAVLAALAIAALVVLAIRYGIAEEAEVPHERAVVVTDRRVIFGDTVDQPVDQALGALPLDAVTHATVGVGGRAVSPTQGTSRIGFHGPAGEILAVVVPGERAGDAAKRLGVDPQLVAGQTNATNHAGGAWIATGVGVGAAALFAFFGVVAIFATSGLGPLLGAAMVLLGGGVAAMGARSMQARSNAASERGEAISYHVDLRGRPPVARLEGTRQALTAVRLGAGIGSAALVIAGSLFLGASTDDEPIVVGGPERTVEAPAPALAAPAGTIPPNDICASSDGSLWFGGIQRFGDAVFAASGCGLQRFETSGASGVGGLCSQPMLPGRFRPSPGEAVVPLWCAGEIVGVDPESLDVAWRWTMPGGFDSPLATELGRSHLAVQSSLDGLVVLDLATGRAAWNDVWLTDPVFAGADDLLLVSSDGVTQARRWQDGAVMWEVPLPATWLGAFDGNLYAVTEEPSVVRLDPDSGVVLAATQPDLAYLGAFFRGGDGDHVAVGNSTGTAIRILDADSMEVVTTLDPIGLSTATLHDGLLARFDYDVNEIVVHDVTSGLELDRWSASPAVPIVFDRTVYFMRERGDTFELAQRDIS